MYGRALMGTLILTAAIVSPSFAQAPPEGGPPDFAEMRQRMEQHTKELLGASDEEWKVLQPKIEKIRQLQRDARGGPGMFMLFGPPPGGPDGPPPGGPGAPPPGFGPDGGQPSAVQEAQRDLRDAVESKDTTPEQLKARLQAYRDARAKAKADLGKAQQDLQGVATPKQEAALVSIGILD